MAARKKQDDRRGAGEGGIYQRKSDGKWCASVDLGIVKGRRKRKVVYGQTRSEVAKKLKALHAQQELGRNIAPERRTVAQFLDQWLNEVIKPHRRPRTYRSYADMVRLHIAPHIGHIDLAKVTPADVQRMVNELTREGHTRTTIYARSVLSRALNRALRWELINRNVANLTDAPRSKQRTIGALEAAQARALLAAVAGHRLEALYCIALALGLRRGELLGLLWTDIDFAKGTLSVTGTLQRVNGQGLVRGEPKTERSARTLPLSPTLVDILQRQRALIADERARLGSEWHDQGLVFPSERGTFIEPSNLHRHFKALLEHAGLPPTTRFHDLRHTAASLMASQGVHPKVVMELLGHNQLDMTMRIYTHAFSDDQRSAAAALDAVLHPKAAPEADSGYIPGYMEGETGEETATGGLEGILLGK